MQKIRLDRLLSNSGVGSRKEVKAIIKKEEVTVDGNIVKNPGQLIDPTRSQVMVNSRPILYKKYYYLMLNNPPGVISATKDTLHHTVTDLLPEQYKNIRLFPVGRLDKDTEGLLILTNDGQLAHSLLSPKKRVPKTYYAVIEGLVSSEDKEAFRRGVRLDDDLISLSAQLSILESSQLSKVHVTIFEGKYHQVKRMFKTVGKKVVYLKRIRMGNLYLDESLPLGEVRELSQAELALLDMSNKDDISKDDTGQ